MMDSAFIAANDNVRQFYVYQHRRNDTGEVFYIGKGSGNRAWDEHWSRYQNRIWKGCAKHGYTVEIVCDGLDEKHALDLEVMLIQAHGRRNIGTGYLANLTDGGEGGNGAVRSAETRAKISAGNMGKVMSAEAIEKVRSANIGRKHTAEMRAKVSAATRGRVFSEEHRSKLSEANRKRVHSEASRAKMSAAKRGGIHSEEHNAKIRASGLLKGPQKNNVSGYKGVRPSSSKMRWLAKITTDKPRELGSFGTPEEAARAYDTAAVAAWGAGNCYLNFPAEHSQAA
ncbi:NUMOD3 domain-containing DNA-binding protein [Bosea thiooxidans]